MGEKVLDDMSSHVHECHTEKKTVSGMSRKTTICTMCGRLRVSCVVHHQILLRLFLSIFFGDVTNASHVGNARNSPLHKMVCMLAEYPTLSRFFSRPFKAISCTGCSALFMYSKTMKTYS